MIRLEARRKARREASKMARLEHVQDMLTVKRLRLGIKDIELRYTILIRSIVSSR